MGCVAVVLICVVSEIDVEARLVDDLECGLDEICPDENVLIFCVIGETEVAIVALCVLNVSFDIDDVDVGGDVTDVFNDD